MLIQLHVKNLALIEEIEMEFGPGLNILTGETGAGKSILLGSMQLILGGKISKDMIREHAPYALVELLFEVNGQKAKEILKDLDIEADDGQILLSRKIMDGKSISKINGHTSTVGQLKQAAACLLDIHGQHEHQSLLYQDKQLEILDTYGKDRIYPAKEKVAIAFEEYKECQRSLAALDMDEEQRNREKAFLEFEVQEIERAQLTHGEDEQLERQYKKLVNGKKIVETLQNVYGLTGYDGQGAGEQIGRGLRELAKIAEFDIQLPELLDTLGEIDGILNDFNRSISSYLGDFTFDEESFYQVEKRLDFINNLKSKYGQSIPRILEYKEEQKKKLEIIEKFSQNLLEAQKKLSAAENNLQAASDELSQLRKEYSKSLTENIISGLRDLNFLDVRFAIRFEEKKVFTENGKDDIEYLISTNPGESLKPLGKVASGGELSRIMLAIKAILADKDQIETLIFDEIDTGISGRTAQKVSEKMDIIGRHHQVLCITHLPQIAAMADKHFEIEKHLKGSETITEIHPLYGEESVRELARLLGGSEITPAVEENARELKELAQVHKNARLK